ncbi:uncharacterized protein B0H64DRAFT_472527 [Chaetomium fimeti]|uniref:FAD-binding FR-type domain-containing protein n=1 Tax=Chaetomium fimeti TaxID=1854472 RepID=A0AAE0HMS1_9PEZI|nr:hypothetical protein B0H64DRAFT_472527 [Chaetomium fimeti]
MSKQSHIERTANEPREATLHTLTIAHIDQVSPTIRVIRLAIPPNDNITFLPGQWVDLHPPPEAQVPKAGGFTITSSPTLALHNPNPNAPSTTTPNKPTPPPTTTEPPYLELAIQSSPNSPPAAYLSQPIPQLLHTPVQVRIGGRFVFPPPTLFPLPPPTAPTTSTTTNDTTAPVRRLVLVAGGMGINPLVSMLSHIAEQGGDDDDGPQAGIGVEVEEVRVLYSVKEPEPEPEPGNSTGGAILFLERMAGLFGSGRVRGGVRVFLTGGGGRGGVGSAVGDAVTAGGGGGVGDGPGGLGVEGGDERFGVPCVRRRMTVGDVEEAVGEEKEAAVVYVCGVPGMTDEFVEALVAQEGFGMDPRRVLFEKWW